MIKTPTAKIEQACAKGGVRFYMNGVQLDAENNRLIATDGHILAVHENVECNGHDSGQLDVDVIAVKRRKKETEFQPVYQEVQGTFPDCDKVIPEKRDGDPDICFDVTLLARLAAALYDNKQTERRGVKLYFGRDKKGNPDPTMAIRVEKTGGDGSQYGVIMPLRF